jgi:hypothetical protein
LYVLDYGLGGKFVALHKDEAQPEFQPLFHYSSFGAIVDHDDKKRVGKIIYRLE